MTAKQFNEESKISGESSYYHNEGDFVFTIQNDYLEKECFYIRRDYIDSDIEHHFDCEPLFTTQLQVEKYIKKELKRVKKQIEKTLLRFI